MGVDTNGRLDKRYGVKDIQRALKHKFHIESDVFGTYSKDRHILGFEYKGKMRNIYVFENYTDDDDGKIGTHLSLSAWGSSVELIRGILEMFGGEIKEMDTRDNWEYVSPSNKINLTDKEILEDKLLSKLEREDISYSNRKIIVKYVMDNLEFIKSL